MLSLSVVVNAGGGNRDSGLLARRSRNRRRWRWRNAEGAEVRERAAEGVFGSWEGLRGNRRAYPRTPPPCEMEFRSL
jgi:hypothetical protein